MLRFFSTLKTWNIIILSRFAGLRFIRVAYKFSASKFFLMRVKVISSASISISARFFPSTSTSATILEYLPPMRRIFQFVLIDLLKLGFARETSKPLVVITGSNGKSTVTDLIGFMAEHANMDVGIGGNIGIPALDILEDNHDVSVLEVSSYQLEVAINLKSKVATVLNLTPDHLDRYPSADDYYATKARINSSFSLTWNFFAP